MHAACCMLTWRAGWLRSQARYAKELPDAYERLILDVINVRIRLWLLLNMPYAAR